MRRYRTRAAARFCLLLAFAAVEGCTDREHDHGSAPRLFAPKANDRMTFQIVLARDTISPDDNQAVELYYYVVNGTRRVTFDNDPGRYKIRLERQNGQAVPPAYVTSPVTGMLGRTTMVLPARAILGQVVDLRCLRDGAGYRGDMSAQEGCLRRFALDSAGIYRVILEYDGTDYRRRQTTNAESVAAGAAKADKQPHVDDSLQMADTATLVISAQ